jgi:hypothetical protein
LIALLCGEADDWERATIVPARIAAWRGDKAMPARQSGADIRTGRTVQVRPVRARCVARRSSTFPWRSAFGNFSEAFARFIAEDRKDGAEHDRLNAGAAVAVDRDRVSGFH